MRRDMKEWSEIRRKVLVEGISKREIIRQTRLHWTTLEKILRHSSPPGYLRRKAPGKRIIGPHIDWIERVIEADKELPVKQRHTAKRIFDRLRAECGYVGGYTAVKDFVRDFRQTHREVFMPLVHRLGEAQVDFFQALAKIDGVLRKVRVFCMILPYSDMFFLKAYPRECAEAFFDGRVEAFRYFGGVPNRISYDNLKIAVRAITGSHARKLTDGFMELKSHYLFKAHFCGVRRANEKGVVEGLAKYARLNFMVPVPQTKSFAELNAMLLERCRDDGDRRLRGKGSTKLELFSEEKSSFLDLPASEFEACRRRSTRANSLSLARFDSNDYSVPVRYAHHEITVKGFVDCVEIFSRDGERIAQHERIWEKERVSYKPEHYLPLLERKPGSLDHSVPLMRLELPVCFDVLRRELEAQKGHEGTKDYIAVLRLLERHPASRVARAIERSLSLPYPSIDVIRLYALPEERPAAAVFCLDGREHLKGVRVDCPDLSAYSSLLEEGGRP